MRLAEELLAGAPNAARFATAYNFGPSDEDAQPVSWIAERMTRFWGNGASWVLDDDEGPHEAGYLRLDASRARRDLAWEPRLRLESALEWLVQWYRVWQSSPDSIQQATLSQIDRYHAMTQAPKEAPILVERNSN
jgi:CDP-glucose 4,6-dehydratase